MLFTIDSFTDDQYIHFLDIKITPNGTSVYRKSTHTGQYVHLSSFTPWYRKTAWLRALIHRAYKLCSNSEILSIELSEIYKFASWNGFPKRLTKNLLKQFAFTDRCLQTRTNEHCHSNDSEIYKHINSCDEFNLNSNLLLSLPFNEPSLLIETVMENTVIIDKSKHWSILLYKEAFHIHSHRQKATTKKRYSDTTIQRYTELEPELEPEPCINYANYCLQLPRETSSVIIFSGGRAHIPKNISYKVKMRKVIVCKAPLHQMIACPCLID